jgi:hypothetical protein
LPDGLLVAVIITEISTRRQKKHGEQKAPRWEAQTPVGVAATVDPRLHQAFAVNTGRHDRLPNSGFRAHGTVTTYRHRSTRILELRDTIWRVP